MKQRVVVHGDWRYIWTAFDAAMRIFELSRSFPKEETYSLTDPICRSSPSVCAKLAEAWRKRRYAKAFASKLSDAKSEAAETQVWLEFATKCGYIETKEARDLHRIDHSIIGTLVDMITHPESWAISDHDTSCPS